MMGLIFVFPGQIYLREFTRFIGEREELVFLFFTGLLLFHCSSYVEWKKRGDFFSIIARKKYWMSVIHLSNKIFLGTTSIRS